MAAASYFWSNIINTFLFNQGPMTPTLIDITMITGLDVTSSANPMSMNTKNQFDFRTKSIVAGLAMWRHIWAKDLLPLESM
jgi:hypothetical protein